jgi:hypothetical protein
MGELGGFVVPRGSIGDSAGGAGEAAGNGPSEKKKKKKKKKKKRRRKKEVGDFLSLAVNMDLTKTFWHVFDQDFLPHV